MVNNLFREYRTLRLIASVTFSRVVTNTISTTPTNFTMVMRGEKGLVLFVIDSIVSNSTNRRVKLFEHELNKVQLPTNNKFDKKTFQIKIDFFQKRVE